MKPRARFENGEFILSVDEYVRLTGFVIDDFPCLSDFVDDLEGEVESLSKEVSAMRGMISDIMLKVKELDESL